MTAALDDADHARRPRLFCLSRGQWCPLAHFLHCPAGGSMVKKPLRAVCSLSYHSPHSQDALRRNMHAGACPGVRWLQDLHPGALLLEAHSSRDKVNFGHFGYAKPHCDGTHWSHCTGISSRSCPPASLGPSCPTLRTRSFSLHCCTGTFVAARPMSATDSASRNNPEVVSH